MPVQHVREASLLLLLPIPQTHQHLLNLQIPAILQILATHQHQLSLQLLRSLQLPVQQNVELTLMIMDWEFVFVVQDFTNQEIPAFLVLLVELMRSQKLTEAAAAKLDTPTMMEFAQNAPRDLSGVQPQTNVSMFADKIQLTLLKLENANVLMDLD